MSIALVTLVGCATFKASQSSKSTHEAKLVIVNATHYDVCGVELFEVQARDSVQVTLPGGQCIPGGARATLALVPGRWHLRLKDADGSVLFMHRDLDIEDQLEVHVGQVDVLRVPAWQKRIRYAHIETGTLDG